VNVRALVGVAAATVAIGTAGIVANNGPASSPVGVASCTNTAPVPAGPTVILAPTGDNTAPGTVARPRRDLTGWTPVAGTTVLLRGGTWNGTFVPARWGGTYGAANNITLRSYPGETPVVVGGSFFLGLYGMTAHHLTVTGITFRDVDAESAAVITATAGWTAHPATSGGAHHIDIVCNLFDGVRRGHAVYLGGDGHQTATTGDTQRLHHWTITRNVFRRIRHDGPGLAQAAVHSFHADEATDVTVTGNEFEGNETGVLLGASGASDWTITGNRFDRNGTAVMLSTYAGQCRNAPPCATTAKDSTRIIITANSGVAGPGQTLFRADDDWMARTPLSWTETANTWTVDGGIAARVGYNGADVPGRTFSTVAAWEAYRSTLPMAPTGTPTTTVPPTPTTPTLPIPTPTTIPPSPTTASPTTSMYTLRCVTGPTGTVCKT